VNVETPFGHEAIGVLLAPSHDVWRARILTYPNVLWAAPGGRGAIKFVGDTPAEAEARAIKFVEEHVRAKRYLRRDGVAAFDGGHASKASTDSSRPNAIRDRVPGSASEPGCERSEAAVPRGTPGTGAGKNHRRPGATRL
jgi:hypothetical protein